MVTSQVRLTIDWVVPLAETGPINTALQTLMVAARTELGCVGCSLSTRMGERAGFSYEEIWRTEGDLRRQLRSSRFSKLTQLVERGTERPRIEFHLPGGTRGFDYAEEASRGEGDQK